MNILIGVVVILILAVCFIYYSLNKQLKTNISDMNKRIDTIQKNKEIDTEPIKDDSVLKNEEYNNLKEQYDNYVDSNNFDDTYSEELSENIKNEIDNIENLEKNTMESEHLDTSYNDTQFNLDKKEDHLDVEDQLDVEEHLDVDSSVIVEQLESSQLLDESDIYTTLEDIGKLTVKELQEIARNHNVSVKSKERKPELINKVKHIYNL